LSADRYECPTIAGSSWNFRSRLMADNCWSFAYDDPPPPDCVLFMACGSQSSGLECVASACRGHNWRSLAGENHNLYGYHVLGGGSCVRIINGCDHEWSAGPLAWTFTCDLWRRICGIPGGRWSSGVIGQLIQSNRRKQRLAKVKTYHRYNLSWAKLLHLN